MVNNYPDRHQFKLNIVHPKPPCIHCDKCSTPIFEKDTRITVIQLDKRINYCSQQCLESYRREKESKEKDDGK
jgi:predicted sulfurtransferase